jgi:Zn-dependent protease with chaperone function
MQTQPSLDEAADRLEHNATFVGILPALMIGALLVLVQPVVGVLVGLALAVGWVLAVRARIAGAPQRVTDGLGATTLSPGSRPRLENVLEGLCATSGVVAPEVLVVDSPAMNALVAAGRDQSRIVLTSGLVDQLGRLELGACSPTCSAGSRTGRPATARRCWACWAPHPGGQDARCAPR